MLIRLDVERYVGWMNDAEAMKWTRHKGGYTKEKFGELMASDRKIWVLCHDGQMAGIASLIPCGGGTGEMAVMVGKEYWGLGLSTEAFHEIVRWAKENGYTRLVGGCHKDNKAANRLLLKTGFVFTHESGEHNYYVCVL